MAEATPLGTESRSTSPARAQSCGEAVVRLLEQYDTDTVFGIPGVHTLEIYRGLAASDIRHVSARHEQGAAFMADGYARVARKPGVCTLITGAGLTNAATPIAGAYHDSIPLLIVSSATACADNGRGHGALHDLPDQRAFMATITADSIEVRDPADLPDAFARAFEIFESRRPRPVHIGIPIDVLDLHGAAWERLPARGSPPLADPALVERAVELLAGAERPMVLLGGGAVAAGAEAAAVAERLGAPVGMTVNAKGVLPDSHPLSLGTTLTLRPVHAAFAEADVVLAVGTEFGETDYFYAPGAAAPDFAGSLVRIDIDADQLHRQRPAAVGLQGDAAATLAAIDAGLHARGRERTAGAERAAALREDRRWWPGAGVAPAVPPGARARDPARTASSSPTRRSRRTSPTTPGRAAQRARTSLPAASARSGPPCRWRSARSSPRPVARSPRWPATAARCSRSPSSRARQTSGCRSRS